MTRIVVNHQFLRFPFQPLVPPFISKPIAEGVATRNLAQLIQRERTLDLQEARLALFGVLRCGVARLRLRQRRRRLERPSWARSAAGATHCVCKAGDARRAEAGRRGQRRAEADRGGLKVGAAKGYPFKVHNTKNGMPRRKTRLVVYL